MYACHAANSSRLRAVRMGRRGMTLRWHSSSHSCRGGGGGGEWMRGGGGDSTGGGGGGGLGDGEGGG
eukprot:5728896-Prymnesium_polylepis.2